MTTWKRAIIVGASSGIGEALARALAADGSQVALVARREDKLRALAAEISAKFYVHDVTDTSSVPALFSRITHELRRPGLDYLCGRSHACRWAGRIQHREDAGTIAANFTGAVAWLNEAAPRFETAKHGTIVGISSVAGDRGRRGNPVYGATKAAFNAYLESLRNRTERKGVSVVTIKPGPVKTPMTEGVKMPGMIEADQAAAEILAAAKDKVRVAYVPAKWKPIMAVIRAIPAPIFKYLNI